MIVTKLKRASNMAAELVAGLLVGLLAYALVCGPEARGKLATSVDAAHSRILGSSTAPTGVEDAGE